MFNMTTTLEVIEIKKKTKAKVFENVEVGDIIKFSVPLKPVGSNRGTYASYIKIHNITKDEITSKSFNQLFGGFDCFEFKEV